MFSTETSCYARRYSKTHLADHPGQHVTDIALTPDVSGDDGPGLRLWVKLHVRGGE
jgi:hypothetical protein